MSKHIFILGREPQLSLAEINSQLMATGQMVDWLAVEKSHVMLSANLSDVFFDQLAGSVKQADYIDKLPQEPLAIKEVLKSFLSKSGNPSYIFGFSWYGRRPPRWLKGVGLDLKKYFKNQGHRARLVVSRDNDLSSVVVDKNKLLPPHGFDFVFLPQSDGSLLLGRTVKVQDFAAWSRRDYGRPARQAKVGMLPPKLARLMINLTAADKNEPLLDPFCGSGTVLQEAAGLGYINLWGSDIDKRGIDRTSANLSWLKKELPSNSFIWNLQAIDVRQLTKFTAQQTFAAIVTEPYLGPPLRDQESAADLESIQKELGQFYGQVLKILYTVLKPDGRLVMVWPAWRLSQEQYLFLNLVDKIKETGFRVVNLLPTKAPSTWLTGRGSFLYQRPDQKVAREIWVLEKNLKKNCDS
ncbi:MAG: TRM11 family SAM-dependent methyltransferase [Patescibacteria group bacterium]